MKRSLKKRSFWEGLAPAFLLPFLAFVAFMIVGGRKPFGPDSSLYSDMYHQYYPFFVNFRQVLRSGGSLQFNWSVGMGIDYLPLMAYYLASPLNLLSVLVPESWLLSYFSLMVPMKLGLAGLFFAIFLRKTWGGEGSWVNLFAAFYGLCSWALGYQWNIMWLDTFAILPLVILGEVYLLRGKKFMLYTLTLFLAVAMNYYIGLFVCVFVAFVFVGYEICRWQGTRRFFADLGRIALFSLLGLALTAFLEIPAYQGLQNTYSSVNKFPKSFSLNMTKKNNFLGLLEAMGKVLGNSTGGHMVTYKEGLPNIYCSAFVAILGFQFFFIKEIPLREKIYSAFLLLLFILSFIIRQLDYIWHGMHFTNMIPYRFSFLYSFVLLVMAYRAFRKLDKVRLWQLIASCVLYLGLCILSEYCSTPCFLAFNGGFLLVYGGFLYYRWYNQQEKKPNKRFLRSWSVALACVMVLEMAANVVFFGVDFTATSIKNYPKGREDTAALVSQMKEREPEGSFYRTEFTHGQTLNDGALNGVNGVTLFSSAANVNMTNFMKALSLGAKPNYNRYLYEESSPVNNLFLNLKYLIDREGRGLDGVFWTPIAQQGEITLGENNAYLPLGFMTERSLENLDVTAPNAGTFSFQNDLFSLATGLPGEVYTILDNVEITSNGISLATGEDGHCSYSGAAAGDTVTYTFVAPRDGYGCILIAGSKKDNYKVYRNGSLVLSETIGLTQIFTIGSFSAGDTCQIIIDLKDGDSGTLDLTAGLLDEALFRRGVELLQQHTLTVTRFTDTKIEGTVSPEKDGLLYTSIPYDSNWTAYVDGEEAEIVPVGGAMLALRLDAGEHQIVCRYRNQGFDLGLKVSLAALFLLVVLYLTQYRPWVPKKKGQ